MRIVIIKSTGTVRKDDVNRDDLDLSGCVLPDNFWALQWNENGDNTGHIEYNSPMIQNDEITEIPTWAGDCIDVLQVRLDQEAAEAAAAAAAAENEPATPV